MFGLPFLTPQILGALGIALIASLAGGFAAHKIDGIALSKAQAQTAQIDAAYSKFKASVADSVAMADAKAMKDKQAQDARINALQDQLLTQQKAADARSKSLQALLAAAKPGDVRSLGPVALRYLDQLRGSGANSAPAAP